MFRYPRDSRGSTQSRPKNTEMPSIHDATERNRTAAPTRNKTGSAQRPPRRWRASASVAVACVLMLVLIIGALKMYNSGLRSSHERSENTLASRSRSLNVPEKMQPKKVQKHARHDNRAANEQVYLASDRGSTTSTQEVVLEDGTPIRLRFRQTISSAEAEAGDRVEFEVLDEVAVGAVIAVRKGASAFGTVTEAAPKRRLGRGGKISITMDFVQLADGGKAPIRASKVASGQSHSRTMADAVVGAGIALWPAAPLLLFVEGGEADFRKGQELTAYINEPVTLSSGAPKSLRP
jgi:hypothetical protein